MLRLIFRSDAVAPPHAVIMELMRTSEARNPVRQLSGMMLYGTSGYWQMVEGPDAAVLRLQASIEHDARHNVLWATTETIEERSIFESLPMGYFDEAEWRGRGPLLDDWGDRARMGPDEAPRVVRMLLGLASEKYPSSCRSNLTRFSTRRGHDAPAGGTWSGGDQGDDQTARKA